MGLKTLLGDHPVTRPLKHGDVTRELAFDFADVKARGTPRSSAWCATSSSTSPRWRS